MSRPSLYTRSHTAPQLPPLRSISPISPITIPFKNPFHPTESPHHRHHTQVSPLKLNHPFTRSTSCLPLPLPDPQIPLQKHTSWPLRRASLASPSITKSTKSTKSLPLNTPTGLINSTHIFHRLRSSFSTFLSVKLEDLYLEREQKSRQEYRDDEYEDEDMWDRGWERGYEGRMSHVEDGSVGEGEGIFAHGSCLHLPPEVSMDRSEIEYLRRLEREALGARGTSVKA
ncbi:hypothetical protein VTL71DRAFT_14333 [Oculimacula yallundae]|uniref:Uncharacterized protein n=1 Tax=Oculimacula yallundae TaxID=86028 RepID=A0ABR4CI67_9HELO